MTTIEQLHKEIIELRRAVLNIQAELRSQAQAKREDDEATLDVADDVVAEVQASRKRKRGEFISHEAVMKQHSAG